MLGVEGERKGELNVPKEGGDTDGSPTSSFSPQPRRRSSSDLYIDGLSTSLSLSSPNSLRSRRLSLSKSPSTLLNHFQPAQFHRIATSLSRDHVRVRSLLEAPGIVCHLRY